MEIKMNKKKKIKKKFVNTIIKLNQYLYRNSQKINIIKNPNSHIQNSIMKT